MPISLRTLCLVTAVLCNVQRSLEHEIPRRSFLSRRAIDGSRGRKYFDPNEEGAFDSYGSAGGQYDPYDHVTDLSDIRKNVPGEPGVDYPAYSTLPQTGFTCEGRSRGYYADEAAGCQVFHVCHDVLVSSFLCPIGSTFSQKLLTCDWWTKVDCSSTNRYLEVNRNNYQVDDDEMIRNAYAMISLQSTEDVTKDGLVDPDSGARIIDYSTLGGRTAGYTPGFRRITDYPAVDATGNDLPSGLEDYPQRDDRQILDYNRYQEKIARANPAYQGKFYLEDKGRSPYHASPIIRHDYQSRSTANNEFQDDYRRPDGFTNRLQASYAPTVPTVTTTTRRLYSPTVPTTYRPSTLAYSKLDLLMDSSDHLYAHSKSLVTPPTITRQNDDSKNAGSRARETRHDGPKKSGRDSPPRTDGDDRQDDAVRLDLEEKSEPSFRINVTDTIDEDEVFRQQNDRPVVRNDDDGSAEDIETKDSIGIVRALSNARATIAVRRQDPVTQVLKNERADPITLPPLRTSGNRSPGSHDNASPAGSILKQTDAVVINETVSTEDHEDAASSTERSLEKTEYTRSFGDRTTPLVANGNPLPRDDDSSSRESTVSITVKPAANTTESFVGRTHGELADRSSSNESQMIADQNSSSTKALPSLDDESTANLGFGILRPALFLRPPLEGFFINIPEETPYTTIDDNFKVSWSPGVTTTEIPFLSSAPSGSNQDESPASNENIDEQALIDYADEGLPVTTPSLEVQPDRGIVETSTPIPWLVPSWHDRSFANVPVTDIVPPIVDYNDGFGDFIPPDRESDERSHTTQFGRTDRVESPREQSTAPTSSRNNSEAELLNQYNTGFEFTIRDAVRTQAESKIGWRPPCHSSTSDERTRLCETSSVAPQVAVSTPSVEEKTISIGTKTTTNTSEQLVSSGNTKLSEKPVTPVPDQSSTFTTQSSVIIDSHVDVEGSTLRAITSRGLFQTKKLEETIEATTTSSLLHSTRPGSFRQIEEAIDRQNSPYEVSLTVNKDEDLDTTADDFISRLIAQHQQPTVVLKDQLGDFEIVKSVEPEEEVTVVSQTPRLPGTSHYTSLNGSNGSFLVSSNDTAGQSKDSESNVSMLTLLQLMAELLKLDRLPRPFSTKDLRNAELQAPAHLDESPFATTYPLLDHSQAKTPFGNVISKTSVFDILNIPADITEMKTTPNVGRNKQPFATASPLLDHSSVRTSFRNANSKTSAFDTLATKADNSKPRTSLNLDVNEPSQSFTENPLLDQSFQVRTPFRNADSKTSSFDDTLKTTSNVAFTLSPDISPRVNSDRAANTKTRRPKANGRVNRPFQKHEILEQLTENFGQPLYRADSIHRSLVFDLPQVQRNLDFETGLPIEKSEHVIDEAEEDPESSTMRTTTTTTSTTTQRTITTAESERTIVETEFVPSIGFSFDTDEGREEYVEAILGGLIDNHAGDVTRNESSVAQLTREAPKNETLSRPERHENSKNV
ncbi:uncharacterized protein LOC116841339 [Odontomachus brunneus]|uniref:uncharacterized protein LOC116841339 n=1 Tax=Odontomachus brunneus TaxID=486640 RepID=UPI0013F271A0|nr:uncharacterized protein LOC116841339 [Odontomachus brunneus]XP_032665030.1 uncharacterized protein LOC116841339 [Odontomachus brunneus]